MAQLFKMDLKLEGLEDLRQTFSGDLIRKAMRSALDQSATFGKKQIVDLVTDNYNIKIPKAKEAVKIVRTTQISNDEVSFIIKGKNLSRYHDFGAIQDTQGITVFVRKRDPTRIRHAFIRTSKRGWTGVMIRKTRERYPLSSKMDSGPSIATLVKSTLWDIAFSDIFAYFKWMFYDQIEKRMRARFK